ncbi:MAG: hypothetical protein IJY18_03905 [Clostridia bacterium]|nr:hypothetical protein [Clostridia bacterium]
MNRWCNFFFLSFFSHKAAKDGMRRGYTNTFLGFILALTFLFFGLFGSEMLPFMAHYKNSEGFLQTVHTLFANEDEGKRIEAEIKDGSLSVKRGDEEYQGGALVNTFENEADKEIYSRGGYNVVVDIRPADTLAEIEAYCLSNDGKSTEISYGEYLTLSEVARLNFDFKIRYTGKELILTDDAIGEYLLYLSDKNDESRDKAEALKSELGENKITKAEYQRKIYELYFASYYPDITAYESSSAVPLLRNYYYHKYVGGGSKNYLFVFDDYMTGSFKTKFGTDVLFHGFFSDLEDGAMIGDGASFDEAKASVDRFVTKSFNAMASLNLYVHAVNIFSLAPFLALMLMVAALLTYSVLKLRGVESINSLGALFKAVGSFVWFSGALSAVLTLAASFFVSRSAINALPPVLFFLALTVRSLIFAIMEGRSFLRKSQEDKTAIGEV